MNTKKQHTAKYLAASLRPRASPALIAAASTTAVYCCIKTGSLHVTWHKTGGANSCLKNKRH
jgi:hypothetical protein